MTDRRAKSPKVGKLKRRLTLFLAVVLALAVSFVVLTKSPLVSYHVQKYINQHVLEDSRFEFSCRAITGDLVNSVVLHDPVVRYHGTDASFNVFRADKIEVDYSLKGVLRMNLIVEDLHLQNVRLQIRQDRDGQVILPVPIDDELTRSSGVFAPRVEVQKFLIDGLQLSFGGGERELAIRDVNLEGSYLLERGVGRVRIDRGNAFIVGPETAVPTIEMDVYHEQASLRVTGFSVRLGQSFIMANGEFEDGKFKDLQFIFNPVVLHELHALGLMPDIEGELGGNIKLNGGLDRLSFVGDVTGVAFGMVMNSVHFDASILNQEVVFDTLWGEVYGAKLAGDFRYGWDRKKGFTFDGKVGGMDLRQGFIPDAGLPEMDLHGGGTLHYDGDETYTISARLDSARIDEYRAGHGSFEGEWNSDYGLRIDAFLFERPGYKIEGNGRVDAQGNTDIVFGASGMDFSYFWDYASLPQFSVGVSVNGKIAGPIENLRINLNGDVENAEYLFASIDSASVQAEIRGVGGDDVSAIVDLNGRSIFVAGKKFESPHLLLEVDGGTTIIRDFSFSKRDSFLTTDFEVSSHGDTVIVFFKHVAFEMPGQQWRNDSPATLIAGPGTLSLDSLVLVSGKSAVGFGGDYSWRDGSLNMVGRGIDFDLGLVREALGLGLRLEGRSDFRVEVTGDTDNPVVDVDVEIGPGAVDRVLFDALSLRAAFEGDRWRLDELLVVSEGDSLSGTGWWATDISPIAVLTGRADIRRGFERPFFFDVDSRAFSIPAIMNAIHAPSYVDGAFTGKASFRNTLTNPYLTIEGTIDPIPRGTAMGPFPIQASPVTTAGLRLPPTTVRIAHRYGEVEISEVSVGDGFNAKLTGVLPVGLNLIEGLQPRRDDELRLELSLESADISPLVAYTTRLASLTGSASGTMTVTGTLSDPSFGGRISFANGSFRLVDLDETYTEIDATVEGRDSLIVLTSLKGKSRGSRAFAGAGTMEFDGFRPTDYHLEISFSDFWVTRKPDYEALIDGRLRVATSDDGERRIPNITGKLDLKQAEIFYTFTSGAGPTAVSMPTASPGWICSIDLDAHKNLWVRNPDLNVELGGQLILKRDREGMYLRGDLSALRGSYMLYNNKFHVIDGTLDFSAAARFRPEVLINAYTPYRVEDGQERRIYLTLTWLRDKDEPTIQLSYDEPGYYESDLWRMLGGTDIAGGLAANTLEKLLNQQMSGMTVYVDRTTTGRTSGGSAEHEMMIGVGKYLWEDLYLTYRQGITLTADQAVEVEYRLRNMIYIRSGVIRHSNPRYYGSILRNTDEYNLDVKFRWEY